MTYNPQDIKDFIDEIRLEDYDWVKERRQEYLRKKIEICEIMYLINWLAGYPTDLKKRDRLQRELDKYDKPEAINYEKNEITEQDISKARAYPIDSLIEFKNLSAKCLWHNDTHPSLKYWRKENKAKCFSCGKSVDAIEVVRFLYNYSFVEAVRHLKKL